MKLTSFPFAAVTKVTITATIISLCSMINLAQAGIIDTSNDSFIDQDTQLEWLDFNITANQSFNDVVDNLDNGGSYEGWRLPTNEELSALLHNAFYDIAYSFIETGGGVPGVQAASKNTTDDLVSESAFEQAFTIMGADYYTSPGGYDTAHGLFELNPGELSYFQLINRKEDGEWDIVKLYGSWGTGRLDDHKTQGGANSHTMLVRGASEVPEPSTLAIFALGAIGLAFRGNKKRRFEKH